MRLPVVLRSEARAEFDEAFDWYEQQRGGLGEAFAASAQEAFDYIAEGPERCEQVFQDGRRATLRRFPYSVLYRVEAEQILVLAVFHGKREPFNWQSRA